MADNKSKLTIEDYKSDFIFKKKENGLNIQFNRVAFIFFVFFIIYSIHIFILSFFSRFILYLRQSFSYEDFLK